MSDFAYMMGKEAGIQHAVRQFANLMRRGKTRSAINFARKATDPMKFIRRPTGSASHISKLLAEKERALRAAGAGFPRKVGPWNPRGEFKSLISPDAVKDRALAMQRQLAEGQLTQMQSSRSPLWGVLKGGM